MSCLKFKLTLTLLALLAATTALAEGGEEGGEGAAAGAAEKEYSGKQSQDWEKIQTQLAALKGKMESQEGAIKTLIAEKMHAPEAEQARKLEELKKEHIKLEKMTAEYNQMNQEYLTKFPERGLKEKRVYTRTNVKSLEALEEDMSVQGRVKLLHKKVLSQYPRSSKGFLERDKADEAKEKKLKSAEAESQDKTKNDITEKIIFQK
jgi:phage host-nuclease inhibitor protein Gam